MMGREDARNMTSFITEKIWVISAPCWLFKKKTHDVGIYLQLSLFSCGVSESGYKSPKEWLMINDK